MVNPLNLLLKHHLLSLHGQTVPDLLGRPCLTDKAKSHRQNPKLPKGHRFYKGHLLLPFVEIAFLQHACTKVMHATTCAVAKAARLKVKGQNFHCSSLFFFNIAQHTWMQTYLHIYLCFYAYFGTKLSSTSFRLQDNGL